MKREELDPLADKVGPAFRDRLARLSAEAPVQAVVLIQSATDGEAAGRRTRGTERVARIAAQRRGAEEGLVEIDAILERTGGHRLADAPDLLGSLPVATTARGIAALAKSPRVKAILEDQKLKAL
ncbi:hypothetical protein [Endothiovibrio diazotrophicus]